MALPSSWKAFGQFQVARLLLGMAALAINKPEAGLDSNARAAGGRHEGEGLCILFSATGLLKPVPEYLISWEKWLHDLRVPLGLQAFASSDLYPCRPEVTWSPVYSSPL